MVETPDKAIAARSGLSDQPLEILDEICYHVPRQQLVSLACMNQPLFIAATRAIWRRKSVILGQYSHMYPEDFVADKYRHDEPPVGEWGYMSYDHSLRAENALIQDKMSGGAADEQSDLVPSHDDSQRDLSGRSEQGKRFNYLCGLMSSRYFAKLGPLAIAGPNHRAFYASQILHLEVIGLGAGVRFSRDLIALLSEVQFPMLEFLRIELAPKDIKPQVPRYIQLCAARLALGLISGKTTKLILDCPLDSRWDLQHIFSPTLLPTMNVKELTIRTPPNFDFCTSLVEKMPHLKRFTWANVELGKQLLDDSHAIGLDRLIYCLSQYESLDFISIGVHEGRKLWWKLGDAMVRAKRIELYGLRPQLIDQIFLRIDGDFLEEIYVRMHATEYDTVSDLARLNANSNASILKKFVVHLRKRSFRRSDGVRTVGLTGPALLQFASNNPQLEHLEIAARRIIFRMESLTVSVYTTLAMTLPNLRWLRLQGVDGSGGLGETDSLIALGLHCRMIEKIVADQRWDITTHAFRNHVEVQNCLNGGEALFPNLRELLMRDDYLTAAERTSLRLQFEECRVAPDAEVEQFRHMVSITFPSLRLLTRYRCQRRLVTADLGFKDDDPTSGDFWELKYFITPYFWKQTKESRFL